MSVNYERDPVVPVLNEHSDATSEVNILRKAVTVTLLLQSIIGACELIILAKPKRKHLAAWL